MTHHSFRCRSGEVMWWLISMPIMERCSSDAQPQEHTDNVHDGIRKLSLMPRRSEEISEQLYRCVNHVSHKDTWSDYLSIWGLLLVEVPCSSNTQEVAAITESVQNQNDDVQNLEREKRNLKLVIYQHNRPHQPFYQPHLVDDFKGYDKGEQPKIAKLSRNFQGSSLEIKDKARRDAYQLEHFDEDCRNRFYWRHFVTRFFHLSLKIETADSSSGRISGWMLSLKLQSVKTFAAICWAVFFQPQRPSEKWIVLRYNARYQRDFAM